MKKKAVLIAGCILIGVVICIITLRKSNTPQSVTPETPTKRQGQIIGEMYRQEKWSKKLEDMKNKMVQEEAVTVL